MTPEIDVGLIALTILFPSRFFGRCTEGILRDVADGTLVLPPTRKYGTLTADADG